MSYWKKLMFYKGTEFSKCFLLTIIGIVLTCLLHYVRIIAIVYLFIEYMDNLTSTVLLLSVLSLGADVGLFFLSKALITQLSFLLGSYRVDSTKLILRFPFQGELICPWEEISCAELCYIYCFRGGRKQKVLRILLNGYTSEDKNDFFFSDTGIVQRKKTFLFAEPMAIQEVLQKHGVHVENKMQ